MSKTVFTTLSLTLGLIFALLFAVIVVPPLMAGGDPIGAAKAGFVNPFASGYSLDAIFCWLILTLWILYERTSESIRHGWVCILLGLIPGVATGFGLYLLLRTRQLSERSANAY